MSTVLPNITLPNVLHERLETQAARLGIDEESPVVTARNNTHTAEPPSGEDAPMATQSPTNVVVLSRPRPTTADRNWAAEAFALSLECAAAGDIAGEEAALRTALDAVPDDPAANINYGNRMHNSGRFQEALSYYNTAVCADAANVIALFNRGNALEELGFFAEAIADWTSAVDLEPDCGDAHYNLARALSRGGRRREALRHWTKYLALDRTRRMGKPSAPGTETAPEARATADRLAEGRVSGYTDFFCLAQRFRCAAAIFSRASAERVRFFGLVLFGEADAEGRPLRFAPDKPAKAFRVC